MPNSFNTYIDEINKAYLRGDATEHTHRPALKKLVESVKDKITATNEPRRIDCGAPDLVVSRKLKKLEQTIGYIECKDIGVNLTQAAKTEQIKKRYLPSLHNFILTDYIEFRWYINGEKQLTARLAEETNGKFKTAEQSRENVKQLLAAFISHEPQRITTAKELAIRMAGIAKLLKDIIFNTFNQEDKTGNLHSQFEAFKEVLIHDLDEKKFADMYAQTICYGLFSGRCHIEDAVLYGKDTHAVFHGIDNKSKEFTRKEAAYLLPKTNPFLRKMFSHIAGPELDDRIAWLVDDLVALLRQADMGVILRDFARRTQRKDPVVHFYETFLSEYDPKLKKKRGVYYTPDEVVSYIVRSVDILLKEKFGLKRGLADESKIKSQDLHKLLILDPAIGTGTFLYEVIEQIRDKFKRQKGAWSGYVKEHLLPRLFGFELMTAPYAICHMKLGLQLAESGYDFQSDERLGVYLTNTLEEAEETSKTLFAQWISQEAQAANKVKKDLPIMVVLGNPPYAGHSANRSEITEFISPGQSYEKLNSKGKLVTRKAGKKGIKLHYKTLIGTLLQDYYQVDGQPLGEKNPKWLQDDYVKFIRFGQHRIEQTGSGILAFITNHGYLDNPTFRGMRQQLMNTFSDIYILDLHGNQNIGEVCPDGSKDVNVFDIKQGVSIAIFVKEAEKQEPAKIYHADLYGLRKNKYEWLSKNDIKKTGWKEIEPIKPFYLFNPQDNTLLEKYNLYWGINKIFGKNSIGIQTHRDDLVFDFERKKLNKKLQHFLRQNWDDNDKNLLALGQERFNKFKVNAKEENIDNSIVPCSSRPFDDKFLFFNKNLVDRPRIDIMQHLEQNNYAMIGMRHYAYNIDIYDYIFISKLMVDSRIFISNKGAASVFPLYLYPTEKQQELFGEKKGQGKGGRRANLSNEFVGQLKAKIKLKYIPDGKGDLKNTFGPENVLAYIYAVLYSPAYRKRYAEFLKIDFPRVPMPSGKKIFVKLCEVGERLSKLHLMEADILEDEAKWPAFEIKSSDEVEKGYPKYIAHADKPDKGKVYINKDQYFEGIKPEVWEFHIGGYQVCEKWLKDRRTRKLSYDDIKHYQKITVALAETIRLMKEPCLTEMFDNS